MSSLLHVHVSAQYANMDMTNFSFPSQLPFPKQ
jgi:hypothetical protein